MKTNRIAIIPNLGSIPQCWLYKDRQYWYMEKGRVGDKLPTTSIGNKGFLEKNGIPFHELSGTTLEYWSPDFYEEVSLTLPLYIPYENGYRYIKEYTGNVITSDTQDEAFSFSEKVEQEIKEEQERSKKEEQERSTALELLKALNGRPAVGISDELLSYPGISPYNGGPALDLAYNGNTIKVLKVYLLSRNWCSYKIPTVYYAVFDMNQLPSNGILELPVPERDEAMFIGRDGWQVKEWCKTLGLKKIIVKPIK